MSNIMHTNSDMARDMLARIEIAHGDWTAYGFDGRLTTDAIETVDQDAAGCGYRARFLNNPHGRDYGWGPLGQIEAAAVAFFLAQHLAAIEDDE